MSARNTRSQIAVGSRPAALGQNAPKSSQSLKATGPRNVQDSKLGTDFLQTVPHRYVDRCETRKGFNFEEAGGPASFLTLDMDGSTQKRVFVQAPPAEPLIRALPVNSTRTVVESKTNFDRRRVPSRNGSKSREDPSSSFHTSSSSPCIDVVPQMQPVFPNMDDKPKFEGTWRFFTNAEILEACQARGYNKDVIMPALSLVHKRRKIKRIRKTVPKTPKAVSKEKRSSKECAPAPRSAKVQIKGDMVVLRDGTEMDRDMYELALFIASKMKAQQDDDDDECSSWTSDLQDNTSANKYL